MAIPEEAPLSASETVAPSNDATVTGVDVWPVKMLPSEGVAAVRTGASLTGVMLKLNVVDVIDPPAPSLIPNRIRSDAVSEPS